MIADEIVTKSFLQSALDAAMNQLRAEFRVDVRELETRLTLRTGVMLAAAVAVLAAIVKL